MYTIFTNYFGFYWKRRLLMKLSIVNLVILISGLQLLAANNVNSQDLDSITVTVEIQNGSLEELFRQIEQQTSLKFVYGLYISKDRLQISIPKRSRTVKSTLDIGLRGTDLLYQQKNDNIVIYPHQVPTPMRTPHRVAPRIQRVDRFIAQELVEGVVVDEAGVPLIGVNVLVEGTNQGTATDIDGRFVLEDVDDNATLIFSYVGYQTQEVALNSRSNLTVTMVEDLQTLDEVVVVGYGTVKKSDLTGSVAQIKSSEINSFPTTNIMQALSGRASGVQVIQNTGAPGGGISLRIRGTNSIQGGNEPLYVIDGFPFSGSPTNLNGSDIESIEVLKDASATAIYGSRGANGVVLITTKKGSAGATKISFESSYGSQSLRKKLDLLNGTEYATLFNIQAENDGVNPYFTQGEIDGFGEGFDWQDFIFTTAPMLNNSLNVSGGNQKTTFNIGGSSFNQKGIIKGSNYNRYSLRTSVNHKANDFFQVNLTSSISNLTTERKDSGGGSRGGSMIGAAISGPPILTPYNEDGSYRVLATEYPFIAPDLINPLNHIYELTNQIKANVVLTNLSFIINPIPDITIKISGGVENRDDRSDDYRTRNFLNSDGSAGVSTSQFRSILSENTISYDKEVNKNHRFNLLGGFTFQDFVNTHLSGNGAGFLSDAFESYNLGASGTPGIPQTSYSKSVILSYLGRLNYSFRDRYLLTASFRTDGSSKYSEGEKWGYFPSGAFAWRISEEDFIKSSPTISELKFRTSWGLTGSQAIGAYATLNGLSAGKTVFGNELHNTFVPGTRLPGNLKWETTEQFDVGFDLGLYNNKLFFTADYYIKNTRDLLNTVRLPTSFGYTTTIRNIGQVRNKGIELGLDANILDGAFGWSLFGNISFNKNEVVSLYDGEDILGGNVGVLVVSDNATILREGRPIGQFWGYIENGYTEDGRIDFVDLNNDGILSSDDKTYVGDPNPDFIFGLNSNMTFMNFELDVFLQGSYGNDIYNVSSIPSTLDHGQGLNMLAEVLYDHWTPDNQDAKYPIISRNTGARVSDRFVEDGSYLRFRNIRLSYNLPFSTMGINGIQNAQVYVSGQNLITLTGYSWWDPEVNSRGAGTQLGIDHYTYPVSKILTFGLKLDF